MIDDIIKSALRAIDPLKETVSLWEEVDMIEVSVKPNLTDPGTGLFHEVIVLIGDIYYRYSDGGSRLRKPTLDRWDRKDFEN